jgi:DNA-binding MarR family transcriptional regulator
MMSDDLAKSQYEALAEFRYQIRRFQRFSEEVAREAELEPQQHQLLLAIKGSPDERLSIGAVAERLQIVHHSAVELVARASTRGLVERVRGEADRRQVFVTLTPHGAEALRELSAAHHREMQTAAPELIRILQQVIADQPSRGA